MTLYQITRTDTGAVVGRCWTAWQARALCLDLAWVLATDCAIVAVAL